MFKLYIISLASLRLIYKKKKRMHLQLYLHKRRPVKGIVCRIKCLGSVSIVAINHTAYDVL